MTIKGVPMCGPFGWIIKHEVRTGVHGKETCTRQFLYIYIYIINLGFDVKYRTRLAN